jgi:hypothetical protein
MKTTLMLIGFMCATLSGHALERTVALPYDYSRSVNQVYVPGCTDTQYVGVSGTQFVCRDMETGADKTVYPDQIICKQQQAAAGYPPTYLIASRIAMGSCTNKGGFCGDFVSYGYGDSLYYYFNRKIGTYNSTGGKVAAYWNSSNDNCIGRSIQQIIKEERALWFPNVLSDELESFLKLP